MEDLMDPCVQHGEQGIMFTTLKVLAAGLWPFFLWWRAMVDVQDCPPLQACYYQIQHEKIT